MSNTDPLSFAADLVTRDAGAGSAALAAAGASGKPSLSASDAADRLIGDHLWQAPGAPLTITYAYRSTGTPPTSDASGFSQFSAQQIATTELALKAWAQVANVNFVRVDDGASYSDNATILFGNYLSGADAGFTVLPGSRSASSPTGDVWINAGDPDNFAPTPGNYGGLTLIHEIGHALGLLHPSDYDSDTTGLTFAQKADYLQDTLGFTVMSYFTASYQLPVGDTGYPFTPQLDDITAIQRLYGANTGYNAGDTSYGVDLMTRAGLGLDYSARGYVLWDGGGTDTIGFSKASNGTGGGFIDLRPGASFGNITVGYQTQIENAAGAQTIIGNALNNVLTAYPSGSFLYGEGGDDTLIGGGGSDTFDGGSGTNRIDGGGGVDTLLLAGAIGDYITSRDANGTYRIVGLGATDLVTNVESVKIGLVGSSPSNLTTFSFAAFAGLTSAQTIHAPASDDYNNDGRADLLVQTNSGAVAPFYVLDTSLAGSTIKSFVITQGSGFASVPPNWSVAAQLDWNGDGRGDLLWRNNDGALSMWRGAQNGFDQAVYNNGAIGNDWQIVGAGDLDGDGRDDLVWQNAAGDLSLWRSTGSGFQDMAHGSLRPGADWHLVDVGDLDADGYGDLVWRTAAGGVVVWTGSQSGFVQSSTLTGMAGNGWKLVGVEDISGDGRDDLVWQNDNGGVTVWRSTATGFDAGSYGVTTPNAFFALGTKASSWHVTQLSDVNLDGRTDVIVMNASGASQVYQSSATSGGFSLQAGLGGPGGAFSQSVTAGFNGTPLFSVGGDRIATHAVFDYMGDHNNDILWRKADGSIMTWSVQYDGSSVQIGLSNLSADVSWKIAGTFDMDGDGRSDILWRQDGGAVSVWKSIGSGFDQASYYHGSVPNDWRIAGAGDLNGDGRGDILWQNNDGSLSSWQSIGNGFREAAYTHGSPGSGWLVETLGDFNGDGRADILWRNTDGGVATWTNNGRGTGFNEGAFFQGGVAKSWHIDGVGDFNGDGRDDILWRNDNGDTTVWRSNGNGFDQGQAVFNVPTGWHVAGVEDFNADGRADIIWRNDNGGVSTWQSNGDGFNQSVYNSSASNDWAIVDHQIPL